MGAIISSQAVTWSVVTANGGTITPTGGVYTAPGTPGDYTVKATSTQDGKSFGTATVHVPGWVLKLKKDLLYVGDKEIAEVDADGTTWVTFDDHLGSPRFAWDGTATNTVDGIHLLAQKYAPFGEYLNDPATQAKFAKGFTNHEQTDASGLIYMQARFYLPMYGRFASPDPALDQSYTDTQKWNIYSYCGNDPTMRIDPDGMNDVQVQAYLRQQHRAAVANAAVAGTAGVATMSSEFAGGAALRVLGVALARALVVPLLPGVNPILIGIVPVQSSFFERFLGSVSAWLGR